MATYFLVPKRYHSGMYVMNIENEIDHYRNLLERRGGPSPSSTVEVWNKRSSKWIDELNAEGAGKLRTTLRVEAVSAYLREQGLLGSESAVADVGCGPGMFVIEFAKTAGQVVGFDFTRNFIEYGSQIVKREGLTNAKFELCDFTHFDVENSAYKAAFDLVFTSITPALGTAGGLTKLIAMSKGYCFNTSHIFIDHNVARLVSKEVFDTDYSPRWRGDGFYALANLVWLFGYYPVTSYYDTEVEENVSVDSSLAEEIGFLLRKDTEEDCEKILNWFHKRCASPDSGMEYDSFQNTVKINTHTRYGSILWDVRKQVDRK